MRSYIHITNIPIILNLWTLFVFWWWRLTNSFMLPETSMTTTKREPADLTIWNSVGNSCKSTGNMLFPLKSELSMITVHVLFLSHMSWCLFWASVLCWPSLQKCTTYMKVAKKVIYKITLSNVCLQFLFRFTESSKWYEAKDVLGLNIVELNLNRQFSL